MALEVKVNLRRSFRAGMLITKGIPNRKGQPIDRLRGQRRPYSLDLGHGLNLFPDSSILNGRSTDISAFFANPFYDLG
jgi:hypothetical protein